MGNQTSIFLQARDRNLTWIDVVGLVKEMADRIKELEDENEKLQCEVEELRERVLDLEACA